MAVIWEWSKGSKERYNADSNLNFKVSYGAYKKYRIKTQTPVQYEIKLGNL
jgi:hypothetical protein